MNSVRSPADGGRKSEKEKMLAGELYHALDPELVKERDECRGILDSINASVGLNLELLRTRLHPLFQQLFGEIGRNLVIQPPLYCDYGRNIRLGNDVYMNFGCTILDVCEVRIGDRTMFGPQVQILTPLHPMEARPRGSGLEYGAPVQIGSDVWLGGGVIVCPGVKIGDRSVIGAGSVVTRDIPSDVFAAGNPCRVIRALDNNNSSSSNSRSENQEQQEQMQQEEEIGEAVAQGGKADDAAAAAEEQEERKVV